MSVAGAPARGVYFYLSHARSPSMQVDHWIQRFYLDLAEEVADVAGPNTRIDNGFADFMPTGRDRESAITRALGAAHCFVPLYSPEYLYWPSREREVFQQRLSLAGLAAAFPHIQPVLWAPIQANRLLGDLDQAKELGADFAGYLENGLRSMVRLSEHAVSYRAIVRKLAERIASTASSSALAPSTARTASEPSAPFSGITRFVIAVIAPTVGRLPVNRSGDYYGPRAVLWQPFHSSISVPIAEYTEGVARSMMMPTRVVDFADGSAGMESAPGVILVDPWALETPDDRSLVKAALSRLRPWATLVVVVDRKDPQFARRVVDLADEVMTMAGKLRPQGHKRISGAAEFELEIGKIIGRNRRAFLNSPPMGSAPT